jgi:molecular chaperone Hsp33
MAIAFDLTHQQSSDQNRTADRLLYRRNFGQNPVGEEYSSDLELNIFPDAKELKFACPCSEQRMLGAIELLGTDELQDTIATDKGAEATCDFCDEVDRVSEEKLSQLVGELVTSE